MQLILYISHHLSLRSFFTNHSPLRPLTIFIDNSRSIFFFFSNQARSYTLIVERRSDVTAHAIRNPHAEYIERNKNATIYITHCCLHPLEPLQTTDTAANIISEKTGAKNCGAGIWKKMAAFWWRLQGPGRRLPTSDSGVDMSVSPHSRSLPTPHIVAPSHQAQQPPRHPDAYAEDDPNLYRGEIDGLMKQQNYQQRQRPIYPVSGYLPASLSIGSTLPPPERETRGDVDTARDREGKREREREREKGERDLEN